MVRSRICISIDFYVVYALMLLLLPMKWVCAWVAAAIVHELSHILALMICKRRITNIHITAAGAIIGTEPLTPLQNMICSLAGPAGGLCLLLLASKLPRVALCAIWQSAYNLLPLSNMDGGRVLYQCLQLCFNEHHAAKLQTWTHYIILTAVCFLGLWASFVWQLGIFPIAVSTLIVIRNRKTPCKENF